MKITIVVDGPEYVGGMRYFERFIKILSLTKREIELNLIYVNCSPSQTLEVSIPKSEKFLKVPMTLYRLDKLIARFTGMSFFSIYILKYLKNNAVFFSHIFLPKWLKKKYHIQLIHWFPDFQFYDLGYLFPKDKIISKKLYTKLQIRTGDYMLTQSEGDKERMKKMFPKYADKVVKWSFCEPNFPANEPEPDSIKNVTLKKKSYLLYPHQGWMHKNHLLLINALQSFESETLVLTGRLSDPRNKNYSEELTKAIENSKTKVINLGLVSSAELHSLMKNAKAILNISCYEGWSSCVEEGIMYGVPLILSNIPIHTEQCKEAFFIDISNLDTTKATLGKALNQIDKFGGYHHAERVEKSIASLDDILSNLEKQYSYT